MDAALELFAERGVAAVPVTAIEKAAGLSPGSGGFYRHFKDKSELLAAVVEQTIERATKPPMPEDLGGENRLTVRLRGDLEFLDRLRPLIAILQWERANTTVLGPGRAMMMDGVAIGVDDLLDENCSPVVREDPQAAAAVMNSATLGYFLSVQYYGVAPGGVDSDRFTRSLGRMLLQH